MPPGRPLTTGSIFLFEPRVEQRFRRQSVFVLHELIDQFCGPIRGEFSDLLAEKRVARVAGEFLVVRLLVGFRFDSGSFGLEPFRHRGGVELEFPDDAHSVTAFGRGL